MKNKKILLTLLTALLLVQTASAAIVFNSSEAVNLNISNSEEYSFNQTGLNLQGNRIDNFFAQGECQSNEAIKTIYPNGSYACNQLSTTTEAENLSETLAAGNVANQSIEFDSSTGVQLGDGTTSTASNSDIAIGDGASVTGTSNDNAGIAIGKGAVSKAYYGIALGQGAEADSTSNTISIGYQANQGNSCQFCLAAGGDSDSGFYGTALGHGADTSSAQRATAIGEGSSVTGDDAVAIGSVSSATADDSIAIGADGSNSDSGASASAQGAVAIGDRANAPNQYEATFGNLNGEELDLNVTGNATIHGSGGLNMPNGIEIRGSVGDAEDIAIGKDSSTNDDGDYEVAIGYNAQSFVNGVAIGRGTSSENGNSVAIGPSSEAQQSSAVAIGNTAKATGGDAISIGDSTKAFANSVAIGSNSEAPIVGVTQAVALGAESSATADGAVAIGSTANAPNSYEATFGNLNGEELDVNVTGNATVHQDLEVKGRVDEQNVRDISYSSGHTAWSSGLSTEEVNRFGTTSTESVEVERLDVQLKGGSTNSNFEVEAYDAGSSTVLGSTTAGTPINDVGTTSEGGDLTIRVTNNDGSDVTASITLTGHVVE